MRVAYVDVPLDVVLGEGLLKDLVVVHVLVRLLRLPLALVHGHVPVDRIDYLTVYSARGALLDLCQVQLKVTI